ncbi:hypothetical protein AB4Z40_27355 [Bosea sp. 2YAB26]|uniref:hypothetical protein n=1 Tax=Bosea sp. 2YAB26 TaxID=3237478 RepID=UPI003F92A1FC
MFGCLVFAVREARRSDRFERDGDSLADADAHRRERATLAGEREFERGRAGDAPASRNAMSFKSCRMWK